MLALDGTPGPNKYGPDPNGRPGYGWGQPGSWGQPGYPPQPGYQPQPGYPPQPRTIRRSRDIRHNRDTRHNRDIRHRKAGRRRRDSPEVRPVLGSHQAKTGSGIWAVNTRDAARRWADTWLANWVARSPEPIVALFGEGARYSTAPFRDPHIGPAGALDYVAPVLAEETDVRAWFAEPIVDGDRASISWWANFIEDGAETTYAGTSILRFDAQGLVIDEWDSWNRSDGRVDPPAGWGAR